MQLLLISLVLLSLFLSELIFKLLSCEIAKLNGERFVILQLYFHTKRLRRKVLCSPSIIRDILNFEMSPDRQLCDNDSDIE